MNIGIPRALSYFDNFPIWQNFINQLGFKTTISSPTNKEILNKGVHLCVDDACLPLKVFHGHVADLIGRVDAIFIPRLVSIVPKEFICPKFIGLPEMIKNSIKDLPPLLIFNYDVHRGYKAERRAFQDLGMQLGANTKLIDKAYKEAKRKQALYEMMLESGENPLGILHPLEKWEPLRGAKGTIGIVGHSYLLYDRHLSMDIIKKVRDKGYNVKMPSNIPIEIIENNLKNMPKRLFWSYGKRMLGCGMEWLKGHKVEGIIFLSSFGCGIDSFIEELLHRYNARQLRLPLATFTLDEHSGQGGFNTRLEAFLDMMEWRDEGGYNISPHGKDVYSS